MRRENNTAVWLMRILLALLLWWGSEVLLWNDPLSRPLVEYAIILPAYILLATLLLDFMARYRLRDVWGMMALGGIYGLLNSAIVNPTTALIDTPRTLVTRALGAHSLIGLVMLVLFLILIAGEQRKWQRVLILLSVFVGLSWGVWTRLAPEQADVIVRQPAFVELLIWAAIWALWLTIWRWLFSRSEFGEIQAASLVLPLPALLLVCAALGVFFLLRFAQNLIPSDIWSIMLVLLTMCMAMLWFRRETRRPFYAATALPPKLLPCRWAIVSLAFFLAIFTAAYHLPIIGTDDTNQLTVLVFGFTLYGFGWLPVSALFIGVRAYIRQIQGAGF